MYQLNRHIFQFTLLLGVILLVIMANSCSTSREYTRPMGNVNTIDSLQSINTASNQMAPVQRLSTETCSAENREFESLSQGALDGIHPSSHYITEFLNENDFNKKAIEFLTKHLESLVFTAPNDGYAAFSHPPSPQFADINQLPINTETGGTDIFKFQAVNGELKFYNFSEINSKFWDSHPHAVRDTVNGECITLILWSSDRELPYSVIHNLDGTKIIRQNTDIYYTFVRENGSITSINKFSASINNSKNQASPFIYCLCHKPRLFYSSFDERYDLYSVDLEIDFENLTIYETSTPKLLSSSIADGENLIHTEFDELFPFVALPISENGSKNRLYFASNRYDTLKMDKKAIPMIRNFGGYDIYRFNLTDEYDCPKAAKPKVQLNIVVKDITNPDAEIRMPVIEVNAINSDAENNIAFRDFQAISSMNKDHSLSSEDRSSLSEIELKAHSSIENNKISKSDTEILNSMERTKYSQNSATINLQYGKSYLVRGGSDWHGIDCDESEDSVIYFYSEPLVKSITGQKVTGKTKLSRSNHTASFAEYAEVIKKNLESKIAREIRGADTVDVTYKTEYEYTVLNTKADRVEYQITSRITPSWTSIHHFSTPEATEIEIIGASSLSEKSRNFALNIEQFKQDTIIHDTIYVYPRYFIKPPCDCNFNTIIAEVNRNVPYFQTGFWEVNTRRNLSRHLVTTLDSRKFNEAKWIELHKDNRYFGSNYSVGRERRKDEYREFASTVDRNFRTMTSIISEQIIPNFERINSNKNTGKLIIKLEAWSDRRPVQRGWYLGEVVQYYEAMVNDGGFVDFNKVIVKDGNNLNENNDTLSKLRAYYGYKELLARMQDYPNFAKYLDSGLVLLPDEIKSDADFEKRFEDSKIIFLIHGMYYDPASYKIAQYLRGKDSTYYMLDTIRRIDVYVDKMEYQNGQLMKDPCCNPKIDCIDFVISSPKMKSYSLAQSDRYIISFGAFADRSNAESLNAKLYAAMIQNAKIVPLQSGSRTLYRLQTQPYSSYAEAERVLNNYSIMLARETDVSQFAILKAPTE